MIAHVGYIETSKIFYTAALALLGYQFASHYRRNGKPSLRTQYCANYYGAFVLAPDDYNIEAVCREAE